MTSQIVIMNSHGFAFASDSAVSAGRYSSNSVQKIFTLPGRQPVAFMVMGSAIHAPSGLSWDRVMYEYHLHYIKKNGIDGELKTMDEYVNDFTKFLESIISTKENNWSLMRDLYSFFSNERSYIWKDIDESSNPQFNDFSNSPTAKFSENIADTLRFFREQTASTTAGAYKYEQIIHTYHKDIEDLVRAIIAGRIEPDSDLLDTMVEFIARHLVFYETDDFWKDSNSTVVLAGFGINDVCPSYVKLKTGSVTIGLEHDVVVERNIVDRDADRAPSKSDKNKISKSRVFIEPLAQDRFTTRITTGMDKSYWRDSDISRDAENLVKEWLEVNGTDVVSKVPGIGPDKAAKVVKQLFDADMPHEVGARHWKGVMGNIQDTKGSFRSAVDRLSPIDLCKMAKHLIETEVIMSSFIDSSRSVDLPVDSCYVTKENGFVWQSKKNIPDSKINPKIFSFKRDGTLFF